MFLICLYSLIFDFFGMFNSPVGSVHKKILFVGCVHIARLFSISRGDSLLLYREDTVSLLSIERRKILSPIYIEERDSVSIERRQTPSL